MASFVIQLITYLCEEPPPPRLSFPEPILHYIAMNPSTPKMYQKLIKTSKYFFTKNPILVVPYLAYEHHNGWKILSDNKPWKKDIDIDVEKIFCKIWITGSLYIFSDSDPTVASWFIQNKLFRHESSGLCSLILRNQTITFNELFPHFSLFLKQIFLINSSIKCENGAEATVDMIMANLPNIEKFYCTAPIDSPNFVENLLNIPHLSNVFILLLSNISESFDIEKMYDYIKKNQRTCVYLIFNDTISQQYRNRLQQIVNEILENATPFWFFFKRYLPLCIRFPGEDRQKSLMLQAQHKKAIETKYWHA